MGPYREGEGTPPAPLPRYEACRVCGVASWWHTHITYCELDGWWLRKWPGIATFVLAFLSVGSCAIGAVGSEQRACETACTDLGGEFVRLSEYGCFCRRDGRGFQVASKGADHAASLEPDGLRRVVRDCNAVVRALGSAEKRVLAGEEGPMRKLRPARLR